MESRPDLVTGTVFKTVVGAFNAPGRVRFPCGSAIFLLVVAAGPALAAPDVSAAARALAEAACNDQPLDVRSALATHDAQVAACTGSGKSVEEARQSAARCVEQRKAAIQPTITATETLATPARTCVTTVMLRRLAALSPIPSTARAFDELAITVSPEPDVRIAELLLMDPRGHVEPLVTTENVARARLHGGAGTYVIQLMVNAGHGPEVAAEARVVVGKPAEPAPIALAQRATEALGIEESLRLFRARENLPTLAHDDGLASASQKRTEALTAGPLQHVDAQGAGIVEAYTAQPSHVPVTRIAEVLSAGPSPVDALNALLRSPAHRRHLQDPAFTHQGVALARSASSGDWILVVALARPVDGGALETLRNAVLDRLNAERTRRGLQPLEHEPLLLPLAHKHAERCAKRQGLSDTTDDGRRLSDVALGQAHAARAGVQLYRVSRASEVTPSPTILDARYARAGIGVHKGSGVDGLYVVVILVEP